MHYDDLVFKKDIEFKDSKRKIISDGYYSLFICDFEKGSRDLLESRWLPGGKSVCLAKAVNGEVYEYFTNEKIDYVDDVDYVFDIGEEFYYFEKPCYVNYRELSLEEINRIVNLFDKESKEFYLKILNEQFRQAISGYKELKMRIDKHNKQLIKRK